MRRLPPLYHVHHQSGALHSKKTPVLDWCPGWTPLPHPTTARIGSSPELDVKLRKWMDELWKSKTATYCASVSPFFFSISSSFFFFAFLQIFSQIEVKCVADNSLSSLKTLFTFALLPTSLYCTFALVFHRPVNRNGSYFCWASPEAFLKSKHNHQIAEKSKQCIKCAHFCERRQIFSPGNKPTTHKA